MFYNTTGEYGSELRQRIARAKTQEQVVREIFRAYGRTPLTPFQVQELCAKAGKTWPITSIRRAITNLTTDGALRRTDTKREGSYGANNRCWVWAAPDTAPVQTALL